MRGRGQGGHRYLLAELVGSRGSRPACRDLLLADQLLWVYRPLYERGVTVDFCSPDERLDRYDAVIVPSLYLLSADAGGQPRVVCAGGRYRRSVFLVRNRR